MSGDHDQGIVLLSVLLAVAASYTALDVADRMRAAPKGLTRAVWLVAAASTLGGGIWSMHFVAMLAFSMPGMAIRYDLGLTLLSLLLAVVVTGVGLATVARAQGSRLALVLSGVFVGLGICTMHYAGMAAMQMPASIDYDPWWLGLSVLIAIAAATMSLAMSRSSPSALQRLGAALVMGLAISGMHFTGMRAAAYAPHHDHGAAGLAEAGSDHVLLAGGVAAVTFGILLLSLVVAMIDRRLAEVALREAQALRQSEDEFRLLYQRSPTPLHVLDRDGCIVRVSDRWSELLGYSPKEVVGRRIEEFMTEESARRYRETEWPGILAGREVEDREYQFRTSRGELLDLLMTVRLGPACPGFLAIGGLVDVTAWRQAESALRQSQKMEALGQLTGGVAHDFNNLLAAVIGNLDLLRKRAADDEAMTRLMENAMEGAKRGAALTQRMLSFARRQSLEPRSISVAKLAQGMEELLSRTIGSGIRIQSRFPTEDLLAFVDAHQLELALLNLAVNARDAMPDGGLIEITAREEQVGSGRLPGLQPGRYVAIAVRDSGVGMDDATLARAREPFFTTKEVGKGTGLGLAMIHGFAEQSGGAFELESRPGVGTTATIWLPLGSVEDTPEAVTGPEMLQGEALASSQGASSTLSILAVDDDPLVLMNTVEMLEDLGHSVVSAPSGREALERLTDAGPVDIVVTDQAMPGMRGTDLARALRTRWPNISVLLATGYSDALQSEGLGISILEKPYSQADLERAVRECMDRAETAMSAA